MNQLMSAYSGSFGILACPSNQFGKQQTIDDHELLASLQHLRPGDGYEPMFQHSSKIDVNGKTSHPLFAWLRSQLPFPADQTTDSCAIASVWHNITWMPVTRTDIAWNFEKFLVDQEGKPVKRLSPVSPYTDFIPDIEALLKE